MKSGIPWNIAKGIDEEARQAALDAARQAGLSLNEWLNQAIARYAAEESIDGDSDSELRSVASSIAELTRRIRAMDANSRTAISGLKDRLDEIEEKLGRADQGSGDDMRRMQSLKGVSVLVDKLARELDNADETARSSVEGLRRRAGDATEPGTSTDHVGDAIRALEQRLAGIADKIKPPASPPPAIAKLDDLRARLDALLAKAEPPPPSASKATASLDSTLKALEGRLDEARARAAVQPPKPRPAADESERVRRIEARLAEITGKLGEPERVPPVRAEPPVKPEPLPRHVDDLASAIAEITAHQRKLDQGVDTQVLRQEQKRAGDGIAALRAEVTALNQKLASAGRNEAEGREAFFGLSRKIDALAAEKPVDRGVLGELRREIEGIRAIAGSGAREATVLDRFDDLGRKIPDRGRIDALGEEVSALRRALEGSDSPRAVARVEMRVNELARSVESALNSRHGMIDASSAAMAAGLADIRHAVMELSDSAQAPERDAAIAGLSVNVDEIRRAIDDLSKLARRPDNDGASRSIAALGARLEEVRQGIDARDNERRRAEESAAQRLEGRLDEIAARIEGIIDHAAPADVVNGLHDRLESLAERLDRFDLSVSQPAAFDELKTEIAAIREGIAMREAPRTDHLERQIRHLADRLEEVSRPDANDGQVAALEAQIASIAGELERSQPRAMALAQVEADLARLQAHLTDNREESVEAARRAARDAVRELADSEIGGDLMQALRIDLDRIRDAAGNSDERSRETLQALHDTLASVVERLARLEQEAKVSTPMEAQARTAEAVRGRQPVIPRAEPSPAMTEAPSDHLLEPGSGKPDLAALRDASAADGGRERTPSDRRADFIAAARRAAQAAMAEAGGAARETDDKEAPQPRGGAFARIGQAIRNRKKPLLLAAAAIVLAIGALQLFGLSNGSGRSVAVARIEPAAAPVRAPKVQKVRAFAAAVVPPAPVSVPVRKVAKSALVAPPSDAKAAIALAEPEAVVGRFSEAAVAPAADGFSGGGADKPAEAAPVPASGVEAAVDADSAEPAATDGVGSDKLRKAAAAGNPAAAFEVATRYAEGRGVGQNLATAADWYKRAAGGGLAVAQYRLGSLLERGQGVTKDLTAAVTWYQRAADQGNVGAMHNLAVLMSEGVDGPPDYGKALQWFLAAGDYGVKDSQYNLGVIYARGIGATRDLVESYKWFAVAAAQGDGDASARRDEVAGMLKPDQLAKARAAAQAWKAKLPIPEANGVSPPAGGWDEGEAAGVTEADRRALVKKIQALLADRGYDPGAVDGVDGPKTRQAVRAFQHTIGVADTGQIDQGLVTALATPTN